MGLSNNKSSAGAGADDAADAAAAGELEAGHAPAQLQQSSERGGGKEEGDAAVGTLQSSPAEDDAGAEEEPPLTLVLFGRVGAGKSSTANTIFGSAPLQEPFDARRSAAAVTSACRAEVAEVAGRHIMVLDTPGLGDAALSAQEVYTEIRRGISELTPAGALVCPLLVLSLQARVGEDDFAVIEGLQENVLGHGMLESTMVVWTHADTLDDADGLDGYLQGAPARLRELLSKAGGGSAAIDNKLRQEAGEGASKQVQALLDQAAAVASQCYLVKERKPRTFGRRTARRQRQMEAGLLRPYVVREESSGGGCVLA